MMLLSRMTLRMYFGAGLHTSRNMFSERDNNYSKSQPFLVGNENITFTDQIASDNKFVPPNQPVKDRQLDELQALLENSNHIFVLTGAGISTESGIPDYRSKGVGLYAQTTNRPILYQEFLKSEEMRQRYWARNYVGWPRFSSFLPNINHQILCSWEREIGKLHWLVTQNVDALHFKAGSERVTELHGSSHRVVCLSCKTIVSRHEIQDVIKSYNPDWFAESMAIAPDADVELAQEQIQGFQVPPCQSCGGILKPEITFFGDNVDRRIVDFVKNKLTESDTMLILGSSLEVFSGYRFALAAREQNIPIAIVTIGATRADHHANIKINAKCSDLLTSIHL